MVIPHRHDGYRGREGPEVWVLRKLSVGGTQHRQARVACFIVPVDVVAEHHHHSWLARADGLEDRCGLA